MSIRPWREQHNNSAMFLFYLPPRVLSTLLDPPWSILLLWRSWAVRRILVHRVIVSPLLAPCWAKESATVVRRILVISPGSSLHARRAVLVFAKAKMSGHFPLVCLIKCPLGKPQPSFQWLWEISRAFVRRAAFSFPVAILLTGRCDLVYDDFWPCGDSNFLQSKEALVGWLLVNVNLLIYPMAFCNLGEQ